MINECLTSGCHQDYQGTDPIKDSKSIHKEKAKKKLGIKKNDQGIYVVNKLAKHANEDPFDQFGHGIKSYFAMMKMLIWVFVVLTILFIPIESMYKGGGSYNRLEDSFHKITIGNLGHSDTKCLH